MFGIDSAVAQPSPAVEALFGSASRGSEGQAGCVYIDDIALTQEQLEGHVAAAQHVSIDRFTGGSRKGLLFLLESLYNIQLAMHLSVDLCRAQRHDADAVAFKALCLAVDDLTKGRLAIGADGATGHGYLNGSVRWTLLPAPFVLSCQEATL